MSPSGSEPDLDIEQPEALEHYLRAVGRIDPDERVAVEILAGGVSNKTVRVGRASGERWVLKQALPKLRVEADWFADPERIRREALGIGHLSALLPGHIPALIFEDPAHHLLAMAAVPEPHEVWKQVLMQGDGTVEQAGAFGELLATIHAGAWRQREALQPVFRDRGYFESLRLEAYYAYAAEQCPDATDFLHGLIETTRGRSSTLVHGDYSPKNILVHDDRLILLDHEVIHWGDPAFDVGFSLTHLLSKAHHLSAHRTAMRRLAEAHWSRYHQGVRDMPWVSELQPHAVRHTLGCLLARVDGRSPLEYLTAEQRAAQRRAVLGLIEQPPDDVPALIDVFLERV